MLQKPWKFWIFPLTPSIGIRNACANSTIRLEQVLKSSLQWHQNYTNQEKSKVYAFGLKIVHDQVIGLHRLL